ncbi:aromatic amino acid transport family protein [Providencia stuartii]|nr:aromatic amino acid transport family protein [Providencia stuartii]
MFSLPTIMAGAWFINSVIVLFVVCFFYVSFRDIYSRMYF